MNLLTYRYKCECGKIVCVKDKGTRDMSVKLHAKVCDFAKNADRYKSNFNYSDKREVLYQGQTIVGEREIQQFKVPFLTE